MTDATADTEGIVTVSATVAETVSDTASEGPTEGMGESGTTGEHSCGESQFQLDAVPTKVILVLDKSGSMVSNTWDHDNDSESAEVTRWWSLHATVDVITTNFDGGLEFGALLYPSLEATSTYDANACLVAEEPEVAVGPVNAQSVTAGIPGPDEMDAIKGGTPSSTAVEVALEHLRTFDASQRRAILFITDGEANCSADAAGVTELFEAYDTSLHTVVDTAWQVDGIPTYVVGIAIRNEVLPAEIDGAPDGINPHEKLDELAQQGGRPRDAEDAKYYATDNQLELEAALAEIVVQEFNCRVPLDPPPEHPTFVELEIGGELTPRVEDCATEDGWVFVNPDGPYDVIELCGGACDRLAADGSLEAFYRCPPPG
jgi:hypothetical protein